MIWAPVEDSQSANFTPINEAQTPNWADINSPLSIFSAGEQGAWYDPSDLSTMFQDSSGTIPVTAAGQPVGRILDKSGNGNHATQSTSGFRPILRQDDSERWYLEFNGINYWLSTNTIVNGILANKAQIIAGIRQTAPLDAISKIVVELSSAIGSNNNVFNLIAPVAISANGRFRVGSRGTSTVFATTTSSQFDPPITVVQTGLSEISTPLAELRINGSSVATNTSAQNGTVYGNYPIYIGARNGVNSYFTGRMYSIIIRMATTSLSTEQLTAMESWVNEKTGAYSSWSPINEAQTPNWNPVNDSQTITWTEVVT